MSQRYQAMFETTATTYLYFEAEEGEDPGVKLDELLESGELQVPLTPDDTDDFQYNDLELVGWSRE